MEEFKELKKEIKIKELTKIFKKLKVFENLSLSIEEGINIITGDNGSGKTTLLNLIGFIDKKYEGKIIRNFGELDLKEKQFYQAGGFLPQSFELPEHMKLIDFIHFVGEIGEIKNYEEKAENLIEVFGLEEKKKERINKLSGGMKQRAGIISVMMKSPAIVLFDEPLKNVSENEREMFCKYIEKYSKEQNAIVLITTNIIAEYKNIKFREINLNKKGEL